MPHDVQRVKETTGWFQRVELDLRSLLVETAHTIGRCKNSHLHCFYWKMALKKDRKTAAVARAHKLAKVMYFMLRDQRPYTQELPSPA